MKEKLKSWLNDDRLFYGCLVILVGVSSFYLGRASAGAGGEAEVPAVQYQRAPQNTEIVNSASGNTSESGQEAALVASKTGTKYHLPSCPGASQIKPENRVTFATALEAEAAGYTPAANCPGL